jgi:hypothetical protein
MSGLGAGDYTQKNDKPSWFRPPLGQVKQYPGRRRKSGWGGSLTPCWNLSLAISRLGEQGQDPQCVGAEMVNTHLPGHERGERALDQGVCNAQKTGASMIC